MYPALRILGLLALPSFFLPAGAVAQEKEYALVDGTVRFVCEGESVVLPAWGKFGAVTSSLKLDPAQVTKAKGHVEVLLDSVNTEDAGWDVAFRKAEFLGLDVHPKSSFAIRSVKGPDKLEAGAWTSVVLKGEFILHGVHKELDVPATVRWEPGDKKRPDVVQVRSFFRIRWKEFDIPVPPGATRTFAGDGARVQVELKFQRKRG